MELCAWVVAIAPSAANPAVVISLFILVFFLCQQLRPKSTILKSAFVLRFVADLVKQLFSSHHKNFQRVKELSPDNKEATEYMAKSIAALERLAAALSGATSANPDRPVVLIERNGKLESVSVTRNGKTASCTGLDSVKSNCQCL